MPTGLIDLFAQDLSLDSSAALPLLVATILLERIARFSYGDIFTFSPALFSPRDASLLTPHSAAEHTPIIGLPPRSRTPRDAFLAIDTARIAPRYRHAMLMRFTAIITLLGDIVMELLFSRFSL